MKDWRKAWERANRLMDCMEMKGSGNQCPIVDRERGFYTPDWYMYGHDGLASIALYGAPISELP